METFSPESSRLELLQPCMSPLLKRVQPLRIVKKRSDSTCNGLCDKNDAKAARRCSQETDESRGSAPEPQGSEGQLTVPKIRAHRGSQTFRNLDDTDNVSLLLSHDSYIPKGLCYYGLHLDVRLLTVTGDLELRNRNHVSGAWLLPSELQYGIAARDAQLTNSFRSRHSPRLRGKAFAKSAVCFRDQFGCLESQHALPDTYNPPPRFTGDIFQKPRILDTLTRQVPSPLLLDSETGSINDLTSSQRQDALLVPDICVTPDTRVFDRGYPNFWVAIEISAHWHRPLHNHAELVEYTAPESPIPTHCADFSK